MGAYRKKPVVIEAVQWTGGNVSEVQALAGAAAFYALDEHDRVNCDDPEATATVYDQTHSRWLLIYDGDWVVKGVQGELYPCKPDIFEATYEAAGA